MRFWVTIQKEFELLVEARDEGTVLEALGASTELEIDDISGSEPWCLLHCRPAPADIDAASVDAVATPDGFRHPGDEVAP